MEASSDRAERARRRADWPVSVAALGAEASGARGVAGGTARRWAVMWELAVAAWAFRGLKLPDYERSATPVRLLRAGERDGS